MKTTLVAILICLVCHNTIAKTTDFWRKKLQTAKHDTTKMICYSEIANLHIRADSIFYYVRKGLMISKGYPNHIINAKLYNGLAMAYERLGKPDSAAYYYDQAHQVGLRLKDDKQIKYSHFNKILLCKLSGQRISELQQMLKKYAFRPLIPYDKLLLFGIYSTVAQDYISLDNVNKAKEYLQKSQKHINSFRDTVYYNAKYSELLSAEAELYYKSHIPALATTFSEKYKPFLTAAEKIASTKNNELSLSMMSVVYGNYATILTLEKKYKESNYYINKATVAIKILPEIILYNKYNSLGRNYVGLGQTQKGLEYLEKAYIFFKDSQFDDKEFGILETMSIAYGKIGQLKKAHEYLTKALIINKKHNNNQQQQLSLEVEKQIELSEKQKEITAQELENKLKEERIKAEQQQKTVVIALLLLSLCFLAWAVWGYRKQHQLRHLLELQNLSLETKTKELTLANQTKDKIFAVLGHDLQNPINELKAVLMLFDIQRITPAKIKDLMLPLSHKIETVQAMLSNLLQWSVLELNQQSSNRYTVSFKEIVEKVIRQLDNNAQRKQIQITTHLQPIEAVVNAEEMEIVLRNLLSNAIKFTPNNGSIWIEGVEDQQTISIKIKDTGIGLPNEVIEHTTPYPTSRKGTAGEKGTGIGLKISRELVEKNDGIFTFESNLPTGTIISLVFKKSA
jgi:signal transduction histidine kinase